MQFLQSVIDRIHPVIRRDCNYVNLERIRAQSTWDENNQRWNLPKLTIEKTQLPPARLYSYMIISRAAGRLKILISINLSIKNFNLS